MQPQCYAVPTREIFFTPSPTEISLRSDGCDGSLATKRLGGLVGGIFEVPEFTFPEVPTWLILYPSNSDLLSSR